MTINEMTQPGAQQSRGAQRTESEACPPCHHCTPTTDTASLGSSEDAQPDLKVTRVEPSQRFPFPGEEVTFEVEVKNEGTGAATAFSVNIKSWDEFDRKRLDAGLAPGATETFQMGPYFMEHGTHASIRALADCDKEVAESNERNNKRDTVLWSPLPPPQPPQPPIPPVPIPPHP